MPELNVLINFRSSDRDRQILKRAAVIRGTDSSALIRQFIRSLEAEDRRSESARKISVD